jgi:hypothetical protein
MFGGDRTGFFIRATRNCQSIAYVMTYDKSDGKLDILVGDMVMFSLEARTGFVWLYLQK